jgi:hypothetical protein
VTLNVTSPARSPVAIKLLLDEQLTALSDKPCEIRSSYCRRHGVKAEIGAGHIDEPDLPPHKAVENRVGACENERVQRALVGPHDECAVRKHCRETVAAQRDRESVPACLYLLGADPD